MYLLPRIALILPFVLFKIVLATTEKCLLYPVFAFDQKVDHASNSSSTFKQNYQLNTTHFRPGGPILFTQGAESSSLVCMEYNLFDDLASELRAATATLEHRFFGDSFPNGLNVTTATTADDFQTLTMDNVLLDAVNFINWMKNTIPGAKDSRVIVNGGSYGGTLATLLRLSHPDVFYASWPSAPVLSSFGTNTATNEDKFNEWDWVGLICILILTGN